jgi:hypothetical protein
MSTYPRGGGGHSASDDGSRYIVNTTDLHLWYTLYLLYCTVCVYIYHLQFYCLPGSSIPGFYCFSLSFVFQNENGLKIISISATHRYVIRLKNTFQKYTMIQCKYLIVDFTYLDRYRDDTSPHVSSLYDTSLYVLSRRFYVPVRFIPEWVTSNRTPPTISWLGI